MSKHALEDAEVVIVLPGGEGRYASHAIDDLAQALIDEDRADADQLDPSEYDEDYYRAEEA